ncbi:MAG TPA: AlkA N-terminal domain-containing protein [Verrucomicrobiae bacterium]|nr:AlkA N-terminal domain-containing protein [Verrucomicrobiae bacterium]
MRQIHGLSVRALNRARMSRDQRFDGKFFIAVTSTRIYCRPICPSPHAKQRHVCYFPSAAAATAAGFRPCLRCRPEAAPGTAAWLGTTAVVRRALRLIDEGFLDHSSIGELAECLGIGTRHLHRLCLQHVGAPPVSMAQTRRLHFAKRLLDDTNLPITEIAFAAGFKSLRRFNSAFQQTFRRPPRDFRRDRREQPVSAEGEIVLRLPYRPPYDWDQVSDFLVAQAIPGIELVNKNAYVRTVAIGSSFVIVRITPVQTENLLELRVLRADPSSLLQISLAARRVFDIVADPATIATAFRDDPLLGELVKQRPGLRIPGVWDPFECAVRAVLGQRNSARAARTIAARLVSQVGRRIGSPTSELTHLFPTPSDLVRADLSKLGLTPVRAEALRNLAKWATNGEMDWSAAPELVCRSLAAVPGIGHWSAEYVALRGLGEPDAFPASDLVLRRMAAAPKNLSLSARELEQRAQAWRPWRAYAAIHLWRAAAI